MSRNAETVRTVRQEHPPETPTENDAKRRPDEQIADVVRSGRCVAAERRIFPQRWGVDHPHRIPPAQKQAGDIRERVPADRKDPEMHEHGIDIGIGERGLEHWVPAVGGRRGLP